MATFADKFVLNNKFQQISALSKCAAAFDGMRIKWNFFHRV